MSDLRTQKNRAKAAAVAESDRALRLAMIAFFSLVMIAASAFMAFPSLGAVFMQSYGQQYQAKVTEAAICRF